MKTISRAALFEDAWTRPLSRIAAEFGVSDTALRKMCDRHDIPTPGRGYWAQVASGQTFPRPQLRPAKGPHLETVRIIGAPQPSPDARAVVAAAKAEAAEQAAGTAVLTEKEPPTDASVRELHPLVRRTQAKLEAAGTKDQNLLQISAKGLFAVTASPSQADRVGRLISLLLGAMDARGWATQDSDKGIGLLPDGEPISFELVEQTIRRPHKITEAEQAALEKYEAAQARAARSGRWTYIERRRRRSGTMSPPASWS